MPKNLLFLSDKLPKPNYSKSIQNIKYNSTDKINTNNFKNISDISDNEPMKNIKILPKVKIQEPKISNQNLKLDININKIKKSNQD